MTERYPKRLYLKIVKGDSLYQHAIISMHKWFKSYIRDQYNVPAYIFHIHLNLRNEDSQKIPRFTLDFTI